MESPLLNKSLEFATQSVLFYEEYVKSKKIQPLLSNF